MTDRTKTLEALFPGSRHRILHAVFVDSERWWPLEELAGKVRMQPASLRRAIAALVAGGVVREQKLDESWHFQVNPMCPFFAELRQMFETRPVFAPAGEKTFHLETILVVEDEPATLKISRILLESWGYRVLEAASPHDAIEIFNRHLPGVRLLLTDVMMPGMKGPELAARLLAMKPDLRVIYMSGYHTGQLSPEGAFLPKPFTPTGLARLVREELDRHG